MSDTLNPRTDRGAPDGGGAWPTAGMPAGPPPPAPPDSPPTPGGPPASPQPDPIQAERGTSLVRLVLVVAAVVGLGVLFGWPLVVTILAIVISVFLHELGHFLVAKWAGMKVTEFFIGFGPRIWSFHRGETEYGLKAIPAGAYVRIIGMNVLEEVDPADEDRTYRNKSTPKRVAAVAAGPAMNLLIGLVLLVVIFVGFGPQRPDLWVVRTVQDGSAAQVGGLQPGDRIVEFDGREVGLYGDFVDLVRPVAGQEVPLVVERDGERLELTAEIGWALLAPAAAAAPGLLPGDRIVAVDGVAVGTYQEAADALAALDGPAPVTVVRDISEEVVEVAGPAELPDEGYRGLLGITSELPRVSEGFVSGAGEAVSQFGEVTVASVQGLGRFFSPEGLSRYAELFTADGPSDPAPSTGTSPSPSTGSGTGSAASGSSAGDEDRVLSILGVVRLGSQATESAGVVTLLFILATVNIFLALINLVPLLPFDGGHMAVALYEGARSRLARRPYRVDMAKLMPVTYVVVFLIVGLGLSSIYLDIVNPAENPFGR